MQSTEKGSATLRLRADQATQEQYPFEFVLEAAYELQHSSLVATFVIRNPGPELLVHPAFRRSLRPAGDKSSHTRSSEAPESPPSSK
jgi:galactose mutarotase-like enzyme